MPLSTLVFYQGERGRVVTDTIKTEDSNGTLTAWPIPDDSTVEFCMWSQRGTPRTIERAATYPDQDIAPDHGKVEVTLTQSDLANYGVFKAGWRVTQDDGTVTMVPLKDYVEIKQVVDAD